ncbi:MAG: alpha/beta hydrolase [Xanthomonadales bacterium]|nr:alpha/beta hydrolase [Xanthomonadales bacterium]
MNVLIWLLLLALIAWAFERYYLRGHRVKYAAPADPEAYMRFANSESSRAEQLAIVRAVTELTFRITTNLHKKNLKAARSVFDDISAGRDYESRFVPTDANGIPAEWVIAPGADSARRVLYIHGGGFVMGSPKSHRPMTSKFSEITDSAVLAIDYRMMPEHKLVDCVEDCRTAYQWILENGPGGPEKIQRLYIAGDSAGGNLTLSLIAWIRDKKLRAPEAAVALSPLTDTTFSGASIRSNESSDIMLKPFLKILNKIPQFIKSWWVVWKYRVRPANPIASPLLGDLSGLPPTLVQASETEMLLDDARRYAFKAHASGSPVKLQTWADMVHIWHIFEPQLPQAVEAWEEIGKYLKAVTQSDQETSDQFLTESSVGS